MMKEFMARCYPAFESGQLKVVIDKKFNMSELTEAMKAVENNQATGKIVLINDL